MTTRAIHRGFLVVTAAAMMAAACNRAAETPAPIDQNAVVAVDDERLATYVQARYQTDSSIRANDIRVSADDGIVTLRGTVPDDNARDHAVALARQVDGVQTVDNQLEVVAPAAGETATATARPVEGDATAARASNDQTSPTWITTKIQAQYFVNPEVKPWNIDVTTGSDGTVTLRGEVEGAADREEAARIARDTEGVTRVENQLRVRGDTTEREAADRDDATAANRAARADDDPDGWITAKVQAKYFMDGDVKGRNINVDTQDGIVTLSGEVVSEGERRQAVAIARNTDGVKSVTDQLQLQPTEAARTDNALEARRDASLGIDDVWITTKVQVKFFLDDEVKGHDINVDSRDGVVYLKGTVESVAQKSMAETIALETDGVSRVENLLQVETTGRR